MTDHHAERERVAREWLDANEWVFAHDLALEQDRVNALIKLLASTEARMLEDAAEGMATALIGKDSGNWNRAIIYAKDYLYRQAKEPQ